MDSGRRAAIRGLLGADPASVTREHLQALADAGGSETSVLEFKAKPATDKQELAKDIAAMANAGGGVIVYGIAENTTCGPHSLADVDISDGEHLRIRQTAYANIHPETCRTEWDVVRAALTGLADRAARSLGMHVASLDTAGWDRVRQIGLTRPDPTDPADAPGRLRLVGARPSPWTYRPPTPTRPGPAVWVSLLLRFRGRASSRNFASCCRTHPMSGSPMPTSCPPWVTFPHVAHTQNWSSSRSLPQRMPGWASTCSSSAAQTALHTP